MYNLDVYGNPEPLSIYLAKVDGSILGCLDNIIDETSASLSIHSINQYELNFDITKTDENDWYEYVHEGMYLFVDKIGLFKSTQPQISNDGAKEKKSVKAYSVECELEDKSIILSINTGKSDSMEYLVTYDDNETEELVNPYTGIPYDWIVVYNTFPEQLTKVSTKLSTGYYGTASDGIITVSDSSKVEEITELINLIPRLKSKATYTNNADGSQDTTITEYVISNYTYSGTTQTLSSYTLASGFATRVTELITFYTKYRDQLSLIPIVLEETGGAWSIGNIFGVSDGDYSIANRKYQFEIDESPYSFLTQTFAKTSKCIVGFNRLNRKVDITPYENYGTDTGVVIGYDTLVNSLAISTDEDRLATQLRVSGGDNLSIARVNFGSDKVDDLSYKMNAVGSDGKRIYVSDALATKYAAYLTYRENQRTNYISLSKDYESYGEQISEIENRLPNDNLKNDWGTFSQDELKSALTSFKNLLATLKTLYKNQYGSAGMNNDDSIKESYIKTTEYWWDYDAYLSIITEIECALAVYPNYNDQSYWTTSQITTYKDAIKAWETDWTLYGTIELQAKIDTYKQNMDLMIEEQEEVGSGESKSTVIRKNSSGYEIKTWSELTDEEKASYGGSSSAYHYDVYMEYYNNAESAQEYLDDLLAEIESLKTKQTATQTSRNTIVKNVQIESYFTADECKIIYRLYRISDYENENILSTSIDTSSEKIDHMYELLEDAKDEVSKTSRPQLTFNVNADNLLALSEFELLWKSFYPGNFILVQYRDTTYVKLRLLGYTFNPCLPTTNDLQMEFSNFTRSRADYNDWSSLFGESSGGSSRSSSGSSSGDDAYGESDDIDITISNTMLAKLLNTELFSSRVTDVILDTIDVNKITARLATFNGLAKGTTTIDGKCITTGYIIDQLYNGSNGRITNTAGSIINLETGRFNFGGGKLVYDGSTLSCTGNITANSGSFGVVAPFYISDYGFDGILSSSNENITYTTATSQCPLYVNSTLSNNFSFSFSRIVSTTDSLNNDSVLNNNKLDSAVLNIPYTCTKTVVLTQYEDGTAQTTTTTTTTTDVVLVDLSESDLIITNPSSGSGTITLSNQTKTYVYNVEIDIGSSTISTYLKNKVLSATGLTEGTTTYTETETNDVYDDDTGSESTDTSILYTTQTTIAISLSNDAYVTATYSYGFTTYELLSHIGTDYFSYMGSFTIREGSAEFGNATVDGYLNVSNNINLGMNNFIKGAMASNDYWRIFGGGASDNGYLEIATADNGDEPIYVRQYGGAFATLTRTLTLLNSNGHTLIPGTLYVGGGTTYYFNSGGNLRMSNVYNYSGLSSISRYTGNDGTTYNVFGNNSEVTRIATKTVSTSSTGTSFIIGNGFYAAGSGSNGKIDTTTNSSYLSGHCDSRSRFLRSGVVYRRTYSSSANVHISGTGVLGRVSSSSIRYKHDIEYLTNEDFSIVPENKKRGVNPFDADITDPLSILDIPVVKFKYNDDYDVIFEIGINKEKPLLGFIADDIATICPECATYIRDDDGNIVPESWNEKELLVRVLYVVQTQQEEINKLKQIIDERG